MKTARVILSENIRILMSETPHLSSQNAIGKASKVGQTTIGNWLRQEYSSQRLEQVETVARTFGVSVGELLTENLGRNKQTTTQHGISLSAQNIINRLTELEQANNSPPALYELIERAIDLVAPRKPRGAPWADEADGE